MNADTEQVPIDGAVPAPVLSAAAFQSSRVLTVLLVAYPLLVGLGYLLKPDLTTPAPMWPAHAVTFIAFVLLPVRSWVVVAVAMTCIELLSVPIATALTTGHSLGLMPTFGLAAANVLTAAGPAATARSFRLKDAHRVTGAIASPLWMLSLVLGTLPGGLLGTTVHAMLAGVAPTAQSVVGWMLGAIIGIVAFAPGLAVLSGLEKDVEPVTITRLEGAGLAACVMAIFLSRNLLPGIVLTRVPSLMLLAFPLVWLAIRAPRRVLAVAVALVVVAASFAMVHGLGAFQPGVSVLAWQGPMFLVQVSLLTVVGVTLFVNQISFEQRELVNALRREHERLTWYTRALDRAEESVRRQTAADLHDGVAQLLTGQSLLLASMERSVKDLPVAAVLAQAQRANQDAMYDIRGMIADLSPPELGAAGLAEAIEAMAQQFRTRFDFEVKAEIELHTALSKDLVTLAYRVIRELVFNSYKHSTTHEATVTAVAEDGVVLISVADRGVGFSDKEVGRRTGGGFGLAHIMERISAADGKLEIGRNDGGGSRVVVRLPL